MTQVVVLERRKQLLSSVWGHQASQRPPSRMQAGPTAAPPEFHFHGTVCRELRPPPHPQPALRRKSLPSLSLSFPVCLRGSFAMRPGSIQSMVPRGLLGGLDWAPELRTAGTRMF